MTNLAQAIKNQRVKPSNVALVWLGQGGFVIKSSGGATVMVDPYLSDYAELIWGVKRAYPAPIEPEEFAPDLLLVSHWHEDHLDRTSIVKYAAQPGITLAGPQSCLARAQAWGWPGDRQVLLEKGMTHAFADIKIEATFTRHEDAIAEVPDAVGFLIDAGSVRIWIVGDSEYDARLRSFRDLGIDVMCVPINGGGGNMNVYEAAFLTWWVEPRYAVPMHYDMWNPEGFGPGATLDPWQFDAFLHRLEAPTETRVVQAGEIAIFSNK